MNNNTKPYAHMPAQTNEIISSTLPIHPALDTQSHDGVDNVVVVLFQCFYRLLTADVGLGHDELNVLILQALGVDLLTVVLFFLFLLGLGRLALLAVVVVVVMVVVVIVVVAGVLSLGVGLGELGGSSLLSGGVDVLDLGLTKDAGRLMLDIT